MILTSPVYALNVSALMKNFIDHTSYFYHRPYFFDKTALVVVTTAGAGLKKVTNYLSETLRNYGFNKTYKIDLKIHNQELNENDINKVYKISSKWIKDLQSHKLHNPSFKAIFYYNLWKNMAINNMSTKSDKDYWNLTNLKNYYFAQNIPLNLFKKFFGMILSKVLGIVFKKLNLIMYHSYSI